MLPSRRIVNMFGAVGYSLLIATYAIVASMVFYWLISSGHLTPNVLQVESGVVSDELAGGHGSESATSLVFELMAYIVAGFMALTVVFVVVTLPYWLGRSGSYLIRRAIRLCGLAVSRLSLLFGKIISCAMVVLPVAVLVAQDISQLGALVLVSAMTGLAFSVFMFQHYLAKMNDLSPEEVW